jgi:hypothetical protein
LVVAGRLLEQLLMLPMRTFEFRQFMLTAGLIACVVCAISTNAVTFVWDPSPDQTVVGKVEGYRLYYASGNFVAEATDGLAPIAPFRLSVGLQTTAVVTNLVPGLTYYFAVVAVGSDGVESPYSNVATFTQAVAPEDPPGGSGNETNSPAMSLAGMLPRLWLYPTNGVALLALSGAVGSTFAIQSSTNPALSGSWTTVTNLRLTLPAPNASPNPVTILERAFVPSLQYFQDPNAIDGILRCYRIYMPLGYPIVANQALSAQDMPSRLVAVNLPGISAYTVCYVPSEAAYLDYIDKTSIVKLVVSGATIREIADKVATTLGQNWTSASEFTVTEEGDKLLFATVVQTDDPLTDPPLGVPRVPNPNIIIEF